MTFKEDMIKNKPKYVKSEWRGGVYGCPYCYGLESSEESNKNCESNNGKGCEYCWNREMPEPSKQNRVFAKSDLKDGMVVEYRNGLRRLLVNGFLLGLKSFSKFEDYDNNLMNYDSSNLDISAIYKITSNYSLIEILNDSYGLEEIWRRKEPVEFTVKEAEEKLKELLGEEVKIS